MRGMEGEGGGESKNLERENELVGDFITMENR